MLIIIISRSSLKLDHVGSKARLLGHQATQVSDLGPLWPSCLSFNFDFYVSKIMHLLVRNLPGKPNVSKVMHLLVRNLPGKPNN